MLWIWSTEYATIWISYYYSVRLLGGRILAMDAKSTHRYHYIIFPYFIHISATICYRHSTPYMYSTGVPSNHLSTHTGQRIGWPLSKAILHLSEQQSRSFKQVSSLAVHSPLSLQYTFSPLSPHRFESQSLSDSHLAP